jgi:uncharacterized protein (TIGR02145 family)
MAENLNYQTSNSWCLFNTSDNCVKYGRLYTWAAAKSACPSGWHLPSRAEWETLAKAAGGTGNYGDSGTAGKTLKSKNGWFSNGNGTDTYGFSALPGGQRSRDGEFNGVEFHGYWWMATATEFDDDWAQIRAMHYDKDYVIYSSHYKSVGYSVRCIEN